MVSDTGGMMAPARRARVLWQLSSDLPIRSAPLPVADGAVVAYDHPHGTELRRVALDGGAPVWRVILPAKLLGAPVRSGELLALPLEGDRFTMCRLADGAPAPSRWAPPTGPLRTPLAAFRGAVFARAGGHGSSTLSRVSGDAATWTIPDPLDGCDGVILRASDNALILAGAPPMQRVITAAVDLDDGRLLWRHEEPAAALHDLWAVGGIVDVVMSSCVLGVSARGGVLRPVRFSGFPLDSARAVGEHLVAMMSGHTGPALLCFHLVTQRLLGRVTRAMSRLVGAHAEEALVTLDSGQAVFYSLPELAPLDFPEGEALGSPDRVAWAKHACYVVSDEGRTLTAIDLDASAPT